MSHHVQYTIRNVPPAVDVKLKAQAKKQGISLNTLLLGMIGALSAPELKKPKVYHDLDWFFGSMSVEEANEFERTINEARAADRRIAIEEFKKFQQ